jgi:hypothetical protein
MHAPAENSSARLTITPPPGFRPSTQGFGFINRFAGLQKRERLVYGLCGGMCFAALDLLNAGRSLPADIDPPARSTRLYRYLVRRQLASFGRWGHYIPRYVLWMFLPDAEVQRRTLKAYQGIEARLAAGEKIVLGLLYNSIRQTLAVWENHQVLAYYGETVGEDRTVIPIYDPNRPGDDSGYLLCQRVAVSEKDGHEVYGLKCEQQSVHYKPRPVRGCFPVLDYQPIIPPDFD